jgi:hypothetical protein
MKRAKVFEVVENCRDCEVHSSQRENAEVAIAKTFGPTPKRQGM